MKHSEMNMNNSVLNQNNATLKHLLEDKLQLWSKTTNTALSPTKSASPNQSNLDIGKFGLKNADDVIKYLNSPMGKAAKSFVVAEQAIIESLMAQNAFNKQQEELAKRRMKAGLAYFRARSRHNKEELSHLYAEHIEKIRLKNAKKVESDLPRLQGNETVIRFYDGLLEEFDLQLKANETLIVHHENTLQRLENDLVQLQEQNLHFEQLENSVSNLDDLTALETRRETLLQQLSPNALPVNSDDIFNFTTIESQSPVAQVPLEDNANQAIPTIMPSNFINVAYELQLLNEQILLANGNRVAMNVSGQNWHIPTKYIVDTSTAQPALIRKDNVAPSQEDIAKGIERFKDKQSSMKPVAVYRQEYFSKATNSIQDNVSSVLSTIKSLNEENKSIKIAMTSINNAKIQVAKEIIATPGKAPTPSPSPSRNANREELLENIKQLPENLRKKAEVLIDRGLKNLQNNNSASGMNKLREQIMNLRPTSTKDKELDEQRLTTPRPYKTNPFER